MQTELFQDGITALISASDSGHALVVMLLLEAKADVDLANNVRYSHAKSHRECSRECMILHNTEQRCVLFRRM